MREAWHVFISCPTPRAAWLFHVWMDAIVSELLPILPVSGFAQWV